PLLDDRNRVPGDAPLHPLWRVHEPLPRLSCRGRPCVWVGLSGSDGGGTDAIADRGGQGWASAERFHLLRAVRGSLPGAHSVAKDDEALARARVFATAQPGDPALWAKGLGLLRTAASALSAGDVDRHSGPVVVR